MNQEYQDQIPVYELKTCKTCKFHKHNLGSLIYWCHHPMNGVDAVTGEVAYRYCGTIRGDNNKCSLQGKWYEPKQSAMQKVIKLFNKESKC